MKIYIYFKIKQNAEEVEIYLKKCKIVKEEYLNSLEQKAKNDKFMIINLSNV